ncbi:antA/AntB antirepressor family protein [Pasteurella atlantica]|uniref:AntA/AntB antirepressor family protein n=2 Tax=Pasteurellaceae TaxID=712 RepID=A0ACC6HJH0_9PAST|nr:antA/AntB antirepressor family protein [Pasteurella atlantica]MDP8051020.1 antA/AntB antirepressor family protein [Pasteurella atlantica]MDP8104316.1 antA/AntB antirepressor family protein [Pasteurella atlantica]MDP8147676.1 antA/AntB antirepressor family protein [Pasteurella atlantica]
MTMTTLISIEHQILNNEIVQTINARELHQFLESKQDFSTWIKNRIKQYDFSENVDYILLHKKMEQVSGSKYLMEYHISLDMAKELSMVERSKKGKQARQYFIECEKQAKQNVILPKNYAQALRAYADQVEKVEELKRTKAEIGSRREATAMATASTEKRRAEKLQVELDKSKEYATVKRMEMLYHGQKFNWRELKSTSNEMNLPPIDVFDANYGTVKSYHRDVWQETYALDF